MAMCLSCEAPIVWAISPNGRRTPVDQAAAEDGNVMLLRPKGLHQVLAVVLSQTALASARAYSLPLHTSHFATCPDRDDWRAGQAAEEARA